MKDFILDSDGKVFSGESTVAHVIDLARLHKGWHKFSPFVGAAIDDVQDDELDFFAINNIISEEVRQDGGTIKFDYVDPQNIKWNASY